MIQGNVQFVLPNIYNMIDNNLHATFSGDEIAAACKFIRRRARLEHPKGSFDDAGRFYICPSERHGCCSGIRAVGISSGYFEA